MNLTFVIDGIMNGLRPFDMEAFRYNDCHQSLHAVSSTYRNGSLETVAFSSQQGDFWDLVVGPNNNDNDQGQQQQQQTKDGGARNHPSSSSSSTDSSIKKNKRRRRQRRQS